MLVCKWDVTSLLILGFLSPEFGVDYFALCNINNNKIATSTPIHISWEL